VPSARNVDELIDAPMVVVDGVKITVDGALAGYVRPVEEDGKVALYTELSAILRAKRELWQELEPNRPAPTRCLLHIDEETSALIVKSVVSTVTSAGYPDVSFVVRKLPGD